MQSLRFPKTQWKTQKAIENKDKQLIPESPLIDTIKSGKAIDYTGFVGGSLTSAFLKDTTERKILEFQKKTIATAPIIGEIKPPDFSPRLVSYPISILYLALLKVVVPEKLGKWIFAGNIFGIVAQELYRWKYPFEIETTKQGTGHDGNTKYSPIITTNETETTTTAITYPKLNIIQFILTDLKRIYARVQPQNDNFKNFKTDGIEILYTIKTYIQNNERIDEIDSPQLDQLLEEAIEKNLAIETFVELNKIYDHIQVAMKTKLERFKEEKKLSYYWHQQDSFTEL